MSELSVGEQVTAAPPVRSAGRFAAQGEAFACLARWHTARPTSRPSGAELAQYAKAMEIVGDRAYEIIVQTTDAWADRQAVTR